MELQTDRLILRPVLPEDAVVYAALWSDPRVHPWVVEGGPVAPGQVPARIARHIQAWAAGTGATWSVLDDAGVVGFVAVSGLGGEPVSLAWAVAPRLWRRGYAREALTAVLQALPELGVSTVEARLHHDNPGPAALLVGLGFVEVEPQQAPPRRVFRRSVGSA